MLLPECRDSRDSLLRPLHRPASTTHCIPNSSGYATQLAGFVAFKHHQLDEFLQPTPGVVQDPARLAEEIADVQTQTISDGIIAAESGVGVDHTGVGNYPVRRRLADFMRQHPRA